MWLPAGPVDRGPGELGEQEQQVFLRLPCSQWTCQSRNPLEQPGVGPGEQEMRHTICGPQRGLAWFVRPGAAPPGCPTAAPSAYPASTLSIRLSVIHSFVCPVSQ